MCLQEAGIVKSIIAAIVGRGRHREKLRRLAVDTQPQKFETGAAIVSRWDEGPSACGDTTAPGKTAECPGRLCSADLGRRLFVPTLPVP